MSDETLPDPVFDELLAYLRRNRGFDFTGYKRPSLERRVVKRMQAVGIATFADYVDFLEVHPDEFVQLFNTILINVTGFFRDPAVWVYVRDEVVPKIVAGRPPGSPVRVWSAGCASGEEAYTLAMILAEALGPDEFREQVKIYGTDLDQDALNQARLANYPVKAVEDVPAPLRDKYFEAAGDRRVFRKDFRRNVIFGRHDLLQDAPIRRLDLLVCRNCLMYLNTEAQGRILDRFHFAVGEGRFLVLGRAEMLLSGGGSFAPLDLKRRVFQRVPGPASRQRAARGARVPRDDQFPTGPAADLARFQGAAFDTGPVAQVVVDAAGTLAMANQHARALFGLTPDDFGRPFGELEAATRPADLRHVIGQAVADNQATTMREVLWHRTGADPEHLDIQVVPMRDPATGEVFGVSVTYPNVTQAKRLREQLQHANHELEVAYESLSESSGEELETANEELQSTVEELETTNEELQSTNEELETMNEELQSANEEMQTMNEELRLRSDELNHANTFLESVLASFREGVIVVDRDLLVLVWNHRAEDLWGLRAEEVEGRHFLNLDIGLPVAELRQPIRLCLDGEPAAGVVLAATNRRGRAIRCRVVCTPLRGPRKEVRGAILLMEELAQESSA